jgi:hypothetical protein
MSSDIREQALLNEYKGNLYEYLVAASLSSLYSCEANFTMALTTDFRQMLVVQESFIREYFPDLLYDLPTLAKTAAEDIFNSLNIKVDSGIDIELIGKAAMASHDKRYAEADILIKTKSNYYPLSIKLSKAHAYVNTKSAGVKSFISKYFETSALDTFKIQNELNLSTDKRIEELCLELHRENDIEYSNDYTNWISLGLPTLPGQLEGGSRDIYKKFLYSLNKDIYSSVKKIYDSNSEIFLNSLLPLIGFSDKDIIQVTTYYLNKNKRYILYKNTIDIFDNIKDDFDSIKLGDKKENAANFDIFFKDRTLQLRLKAMNKFTSKSYKINCSVKIN